MATTSTVNGSELTEAGLRSTVAVLTARVLVPLWILAGALTKLASGSAADLPAALVKWAGAAHIDLMFVLRFGVAVELAVVAVAWLVPSLARSRVKPDSSAALSSQERSMALEPAGSASSPEGAAGRTWAVCCRKPATVGAVWLMARALSA